MEAYFPKVPNREVFSDSTYRKIQYYSQYQEAKHTRKKNRSPPVKQPKFFNHPTHKEPRNTVKVTQEPIFKDQVSLYQFVISLKTQHTCQAIRNELCLIYDTVKHQTDPHSLVIKLNDFKKKGPFINFTSKASTLLFYHLLAECCLQSRDFAQSLKNYDFCEYYSRQLNLLHYAFICLWRKSMILMTQNKYDLALSCLKSGLELNGNLHSKEYETRILQQMSLIYFYQGNIEIGQHFYKLSENTDNNPKHEIYKTYFDPVEAIKLLEVKLFNIRYCSSRKGGRDKQDQENGRYEQELHRELCQKYPQKLSKHEQGISEMIKSISSKTVGMKIRKLTKKVCNITQVLQPRDNLQEKVKTSQERSLKLPFTNCSQVLKSHLSRNRNAEKRQRDRNWKGVISLILEIINLLNKKLEFVKTND